MPQPFAGFDKYIRISLGTAEDMRAFWQAWDLMPVSRTNLFILS